MDPILTAHLTFTAIVTAHAQDPSRILGNLLYQTRKPDEIIVLCSDVSDLERLREDFSGVWFGEPQNFNDWGHAKREMGLLLAEGDAVGFFNADDSYDIHYVERMMAEIEAGADAVYCSWNTIPGCAFHAGSSTSGNFVVRTDLGRRAGYVDRHYEADGTFIERINGLGARVARVDALLYFHNVIR